MSRERVEKVDPNLEAYEKDVKNGKFVNMKPGTYVGYVEGVLVATGTREDVMKTVGNRSAMIHEVGSEQRIVDIPTIWLVD
jgi:hypothetical protein